MADEHPIVFIHLGDPASLAAVALEPHPRRLLPWHPADGPWSCRGRRRAAEASARRTSMRPILIDPHVRPDAGEARRSDGRDLSESVADGLLLARAMAVAAVRGAERVVWPVQRGQRTEDVVAVIERVETMLDFLAIGGGVEPPRIDLPVVDLEDDQIVDLVASDGLSLGAAWPCEGHGADPCGVCPSCRRWRRAARAARVHWPWGGDTVVETKPAGGIRGPSGPSRAPHEDEASGSPAPRAAAG